MDSSPGFGSTACDYTTSRPLALFRLAFAPASGVAPFTTATNGHSPVHSPIGTPLPPEGGSDSLEAHGFRFSFTPLTGVLFTGPSRYSSAIGRLRYLALEGGPPSFPRDSTCPAVLTHAPRAITPSPTGLSPASVAPSSSVRLRLWFLTLRWVCHPNWCTVQPRSGIGGSLCHQNGLGSSRFARRYSGNPLSSSGYMRCFSSPTCLPPAYVFSWR